MNNAKRETSKGALLIDPAVPLEFHAAFGEEYYLHRAGRALWMRYIGIALVSSLLTFGVTWSFASSRPLRVSQSGIDQSAQPKVFTQTLTQSTSSVGTVSATGNNSGQVALTEAQLRAEVRSVGTSIYWAGSITNSLYTLNHIKSGQDFVRYLPNGQGLSDTNQNYRVIATYRDPGAYATVTTAAKLSAGISLTNPDGSFVYYAKATPEHVYLVYKNLPYQIEIFDPVPGASLKLATTPGIVGSIL